MPAQHYLAAVLRQGFSFPARFVTSFPSTIFRRSIAASTSRQASETDAAQGFDVSDNLVTEPMAEEGSETPRSYRQFLQQIGYQYRDARPRNWLGGVVVKYLVLETKILSLWIIFN